MADQNDTEEFVTGDEIEPDESRTPTEFAREELLTPEQIALQMGVAATRVREWIDSGLLTPIRDGSVERIKRSELRRVGNPDDAASDNFAKEHDQ
jgi:excisionase family DNA binding protein